jgi:hypothetical protein
MVDKLLAFRIEGLEMGFSKSESDGLGKTLAKRAAGCVDSRGVPDFRMSRAKGIQLPEKLELIHRNMETGQVKVGIKKGRAMSGRKDETVPVDPVGMVRIRYQVTGVQGIKERGSAKADSRMARIGLRNHVQR